MALNQVAFKVQECLENLIAEELIIPCVLEIATTILGNEARKKLELGWRSNNAIQSRIADLSLGILEQVISHEV